MDDSTFSMVLFSGTDDKLTAAAILAAGAAAMDRKVNVLLQYWGLDAFRADRIRKDHGVAPEAGPEGQAMIARAAERGTQMHWAELFEQAKAIGEVGSMPARCPWTCSRSRPTTWTRSSTTWRAWRPSWPRRPARSSSSER